MDQKRSENHGVINKRAIGDSLEDLVIKKLGSSFHKTGNSGATFQDGDIRNRKLCIECKVKATPGFSSPTKELKKLWKLSKDQCKDWLYIEKNGDGKIMVLMEFNTFLEIGEEYLKELNNPGQKYREI